MPKGKDIAWIGLTLAGVVLAVAWQGSRLRPPEQDGRPDGTVAVPGSATPALDAPAFESVRSADQYLKDEGEGLAVEIGGASRFYPFQLLVWHGAVNDRLGDLPLLVTYAPLAGAAGAYDRRVDGEARLFDVTDAIRDNAPAVLDRETRSIGPDRLLPVPAAVVAWRAWRDAHPSGQVLARPEAFDRDYTHDPYAAYRRSAAVWYPVEPKDARVPAKEPVVGYRDGAHAAAYRVRDVGRELLVQDQVGGIPVLLLFDEGLGAIRAFDRRVSGETLSFVLDDDHGFVDEGGRSVWDAAGLAVRGPSRGARLTEIPLQHAYWFYWAATYPETRIWTP